MWTPVPLTQAPHLLQKFNLETANGHEQNSKNETVVKFVSFINRVKLLIDGTLCKLASTRVHSWFQLPI
jgi:hypothetical protein